MSTNKIFTNWMGIMTKYQSKFYANYLTLQQPNHGVQKLGTSLLNATIDLNPHQIDAALFFFNNPLNKGIMLADEVGLGKTIEAGLVLCQLRSERKRKILLVVPASLRKQWVAELQEKFHLPAIIIDGPIYRKMMQENEDRNPFNQNSIIVTSYAFAASENSDKYNIRDQIESIEWDLVVFDEAHKLRNVYKSLESDLDEFTKNDIEKDEDEDTKKRQTTAKRLFDRFENSKKLLLTATPLQNSLLELFGLLNFLDPRSFADLNSFKEQFNPKTMGQADFKFLRNRIQPYCQRTLRKQIAGDIRYTERKSLTQEYERSSEEEDFYNEVSDFLRTSTLFLNKAGHPNYLIVLIYWKLLASSVPAVLGTLRGLSARIQAEINEIKTKNRTEYKGEILDDEDILSIYEEDAEDNFSDLEDSVNKNIDDSELKRLEGELFQLKLIIEKGEKLDHDNKAQALLQAIKTAYQQLEDLGARKKVLIFTESRRTQDYLFKFLEENGYAGKIVSFNGDNNSSMVRNIYNEWKREYEHTSYFTGSLSSDTRAAIVDYFKNTAEIMIATESASEGVNLQFCSLVINYDLPWNPQRVEQRIGRCHRYGQEFDVIVMNIINTRNRADERVFDLLTQKFSLFQGVFGASDTILGSLESGIDIEKSILEIYQTCRTKEEIDQAFDKLQQDMADSVNERMEEAKTKVIDSFDEDVARRLKDKKENAELILGIMKERLLNLVKIECGNDAEEISNTKINLVNSPSSDIPKGIYTIDSKDTTSYSLGTTDGLGKYCIDKAINQELSEGGITFDLTNHQRRISILEKLKGKSGYLRISKLTIDAYTTEDYLIYSGITDSGQELDEETIDKMLNLHGEEFDYQIPENIKTQLKSIEDKLVLSTRNESRDANQEYFEIEMDKIDNRSEDLKVSLEKKRKSIKMEIGELKKMYRMAQQLEEKISIQKKIKDLEKEDAKLRREQNDLEDQIDARKEVLIDEIEKRLEAESHIETLFTVRWEII